MNTHQNWQPWFAWHPVVRHQADLSEWVWLEHIYRCQGPDHHWIYALDLFEIVRQPGDSDHTDQKLC